MSHMDGFCEYEKATDDDKHERVNDSALILNMLSQPLPCIWHLLSIRIPLIM